MKPSNPATFFVSGNDEHEFWYDPGPDPYYVIFREEGSVPLSVLVFASGNTDALNIVERMVDFMEVCSMKYAAAENFDKHNFSGRNQSKISRFRKALRREKGYEVSVGKADRTQMFKIGWAGNDTI